MNASVGMPMCLKLLPNKYVDQQSRQKLNIIYTYPTPKTLI